VREFARPFLFALLIHIALVLLMFLANWNWQSKTIKRVAGLNIEAKVIDASEFNKKVQQAKKQAKTRKQRNEAIDRRKEQLEAQKKRELLQKDKADKRQQVLAEQRKKAAAVKKQQAVADKKRLNELAKQRKAQDALVKKQQAELEKIRKQREVQEKQIAAESEKLRKLAEQRKAREKAAADKRMRDQLNAENRAMEQAEVLGDLADQYILEITNSVTSNWLRPPTAQAGLRCRLQVVQIPGGEVISATVVKSECNADEATQRSIKAAVMRAGVLPYRGFEKVFVREISFVFKYDGE